MVLAGGVGGIITLLGAYALLGSGLLSTLGNTGTDETQAQLSELSNTMSGVSDQSTSLAESISALATRVDVLAEQPVDTSDTEAMQGELAALRVKLDEELASDRSNLETQLTSLSETMTSQIQSYTDQIESFAGQIEALASQNETIAGELSQLSDQQSALEKSVADGEAGEGPALAALETRLASHSEELSALSGQITAQADQIGAQSADIPVPVREELNAIGDMVTSLQDQLAIMETLQVTAQQQQVDLQSLSDAVEGVAGTVKRIAGKTDRLEATVATPIEVEPDAAMNGARLAYVQAALKTGIAEGMPIAGLLSQTQILMADSGSKVELPDAFLQAAAAGLLPLPELATQIAEARATHEASLSQQADAAQSDAEADGISAKGLFDGIMKGAQGLVTVRKLDEADAAPPDGLSGYLRSAEAAAGSGDLGTLSVSLAKINADAGISDALKQSVSLWQEQTQHHQTAAGLQDQLDAVQHSIWASAGKGDPS